MEYLQILKSLLELRPTGTEYVATPIQSLKPRIDCYGVQQKLCAFGDNFLDNHPWLFFLSHAQSFSTVPRSARNEDSPWS